MKIFFSGGNDIEVNIKKMYEFKEDSARTLKELDKANSIIERNSADACMSGESFYWSAAVEFGKMHIAMSQSWAEKNNRSVRKRKRKPIDTFCKTNRRINLWTKLI